MVDAIEVKGLAETQKMTEFYAAELTSNTFVRGMQKATLFVLRDARLAAPVDTGRLKNSIVSKIDIVKEGYNQRVVGIVGTNVKYAPAMELGTKPHFPPISALQVWARRHGANAYLVARAISIRGLKARAFLKGAFDKNKTKIHAALNDTVKGIISKKA